MWWKKYISWLNCTSINSERYPQHISGDVAGFYAAPILDPKHIKKSTAPEHLWSKYSILHLYCKQNHMILLRHDIQRMARVYTGSIDCLKIKSCHLSCTKAQVLSRWTPFFPLSARVNLSDIILVYTGLLKVPYWCIGDMYCMCIAGIVIVSST
jgi:hypothetical protein